MRQQRVQERPVEEPELNDLDNPRSVVSECNAKSCAEMRSATHRHHSVSGGNAEPVFVSFFKQ
jgi:hypothetical protein